jgi:hypothetical protein
MLPFIFEHNEILQVVQIHQHGRNVLLEVYILKLKILGILMEVAAQDVLLICQLDASCLDCILKRVVEKVERVVS